MSARTVQVEAQEVCDLRGKINQDSQSRGTAMTFGAELTERQAEKLVNELCSAFTPEWVRAVVDAG